MKFTTETNAEQKCVKLSGQFTFADSQAFRSIIALLSDEATEALVLDFADVELIDSAGLGMLLLLHDECQKRQIAVSLHSPRGQVEKIFTISRFDQLFTINGSH